MTDENDPHPVRPGYLLFALIVAWLTGLRIAHEGYVVMRIIDDPLAGDSLTATPAMRDAIVQSIAENAAVALPVAIAEVLLGSLLLTLSVIALFRGRLSVSFFVQVLLANAGITLMGHVLGKPVRDAAIAVLASAPEAMEPGLEGVDHEVLFSAYEWAFHLGAVFQLLVLALLALALTRPGAQRFLAASPSPGKEG